MSMSSGNSHGGGGSGSHRRSSTLSDINVTPLVDVMLVLLIMFMVTAPLMQQGVQVDLPKTKATGLEVPENPVLVVVHANEKITVAKEEVPVGEIGVYLNRMLANRKDKSVYIQADQKVVYGAVARLMAEIKAAGIVSVGLVTLPP